MPAKVMSIEERFKYLAIQRPRYRSASRAEKGRLLDEMETVTGLCRKVLIRRMAHEIPVKRKTRKQERG